MKQTINVSDFRDAFKRMNRENQFSYEGLGILFYFLEDCERDCGEEYELDVIALCCDFSEDTWDQITTNYSFDIDSLEGLDDDEKIEVVRTYLEENTTIVGESSHGVFVYRQF